MAQNSARLYNEIMNTHNMERLREAAAKNGPLCIGLDTDPSYIPENILKQYSSPSEAVLAYNRAIISRIGESAACVKVQIAYYEAMGLAGMKAYAETLRELKKAGVITISDIKRGDIAATAGAYARAHFSGDFESDIITINPYMGFETLEPFTKYVESGKGIFVLLRTSNKGMNDLENLDVATGGKVLDRVGAELTQLANIYRAQFPDAKCSPVGAVVGCTEEANARELRAKYPDIFFLIPGYGAQGGAARIAATLLTEAGGTVNSSRGILCAWKSIASLAERAERKTITMDDIADAAIKAAYNAKEDLLGAKNAL